MKEIWKAYFIEKEKSVYEISNLGRCRNITRLNHKNHGILTMKYNKSNGYYSYCLTHNGKQTYKYIHRMVCETFIPTTNHEELEVNHKDSDKSNNTLQNLEWCTKEKNMRHAVNHKLLTQQQHCKVYTLTGDFVGEYVSISTALQQLKPDLSCYKLGSTDVVNNPRKQKYGYQWRTDFSIPVYDISKSCHRANKGVCQLTLEGEVVALYSSMSECLQALNKTNGSRIKRCCDGLQETYLGYKWAWL